MLLISGGQRSCQSQSGVLYITYPICGHKNIHRCVFCILCICECVSPGGHEQTLTVIFFSLSDAMSANACSALHFSPLLPSGHTLVCLNATAACDAPADQRKHLKCWEFTVWVAVQPQRLSLYSASCRDCGLRCSICRSITAVPFNLRIDLG